MMKANAAVGFQWPDPALSGHPRSMAGAYGRYQGGRYFALSQGEYWQASGRLADGDALFGVIQLDDGTWLADGWITGLRYPDRAAALAACAQKVAHGVTMRVIGYAIGDKWFPPQAILPREKAEAIIAWACGIAGIPSIPIPERHPQAPAPKPPPLPPAQGSLL